MLMKIIISLNGGCEMQINSCGVPSTQLVQGYTLYKFHLLLLLTQMAHRKKPIGFGGKNYLFTYLEKNSLSICVIYSVASIGLTNSLEKNHLQDGKPGKGAGPFRDRSGEIMFSVLYG